MPLRMLAVGGAALLSKGTAKYFRIARAGPFLALATLITLALPNHLAACTCCADIGDRIELRKEISENQREEILKLRFNEKARLLALQLSQDKLLVRDFFSPDEIEGFVAPSYDPFDFKAIANRDGWTFEITNHSGEKGRIEFSLPSELVEFQVDPRDGQGILPFEPRLYHEWRLEGPATLSGIVGNGNGKARTILILQAHGNHCLSAQHFTHWNLLIDGPDTRFALIGKFDRLEGYRVHRVADDDVLNMRAGPGTDHPVVAKIPYNGNGIEILSCNRTDYLGPLWCQSSWQGHSGWLSSHFLLGEDTGVPPF